MPSSWATRITDNLNPEGCKFLDGQEISTHQDDVNKLAPRPGVLALEPWDTVKTLIGGTKSKITRTPCQYVPGSEATGVVLETGSFGMHASGFSDAIWIFGGAVYLDDLIEIGK